MSEGFKWEVLFLSLFQGSGFIDHTGQLSDAMFRYTAKPTMGFLHYPENHYIVTSDFEPEKPHKPHTRPPDMIDNHEEREIHNTTTGDRPKPPKKAYQPPVLHMLETHQVKGAKTSPNPAEYSPPLGTRYSPS